MKKIKIVTFWIGVNILGIPKYVEHTIQHLKNNNRNVTYVVSKSN